MKEPLTYEDFLYIRKYREDYLEALSYQKDPLKVLLALERAGAL